MLRAGRLLLLLACGLIGVVGFPIAYASLSGWQWRLWKAAARIETEGTCSAADLGIYLSERRATWRLSGVPFDLVDAGAVDAALTRIAGPLILPHGPPGRSAALILTVWGFFVLLAVTTAALIGDALARRSRRFGLAPELWRLPRLRSARFACAVEASAAALALAPVAGVAAWYAGFDRLQSRRFIAGAFWPLWWEWAIGAALIAMIAASLTRRRCLTAAKRLASSDQLAAARLCPRCRYNIGTLAAALCPECGTPISRQPRRPSAWRRAAAPATLVIALLVALALVIQPPWLVHRVHRHRWSALAWNWLLLRGEAVVLQPEGLLRAGEVIELTADGRTACVLLIWATPADQELAATATSMGFVVAWTPCSGTGGNNASVRTIVSSGLPGAALPPPSIDLGCTTLASQFALDGPNGLTGFRLSHAVDRFARIAPEGPQSEAARRLREKAQRALAANGLRRIDPDALTP